MPHVYGRIRQDECSLSPFDPVPMVKFALLNGLAGLSAVGIQPVFSTYCFA